MCTLPLYNAIAIEPPIIAAAILSRKVLSTNITISKTKLPMALFGRNFGIRVGALEFSKMFASKLKPGNIKARFK